MTTAFLRAGLLLLAYSGGLGAGTPNEKGGPEERPQDAGQVVRGFVAKLSDPDARVRADAAGALGSIANALEGTLLPLQIRIEHDPDPNVRRRAAAALARIGPAARRSVPVLLRALDDPDEGVQGAVIGAVAATAPFSRDGIPKLMTFARGKSVDLRRRAIGALGRFGPEASAAIPLLIAALNDPDEGVPSKQPSVKFYAIRVLGEINPDAEAAAGSLVQIEALGDARLRGLAPEELAKLVPGGRKLVPVFVQVLNAQDFPQLRCRAAHALGALGPDAKGAVPDLVRALAAKDAPDPGLAARTKCAVAWALGRMGPAAGDGLPALRALESDPDPGVSSCAKAARDNIEGGK